MTQVLAYLLAAAVLWAGWAEYRVQSGKTDIAELRLAHTAALAEEGTRVRKEEQAIRNQQGKVLDNAHLQIQALQSSAVRAAAVTGGLREQTERLSADLAAADLALAGQCAAPVTAARVLSGLLSECSERRAAVARFADQAVAAGGQCAGLYDAARDGPAPVAP